MSVIGTFTPTKEGGWSGTIRTLMIDVKVRLVPNDNQNNEAAPAFRILVGHSTEVGAAWSKRTERDRPTQYLSVKIFDPTLPAPLSAALFAADDGNSAQLVWNPKRASLS